MDLVRLSILEITFDFSGFSNVEIGLTSDGKTVVCYHPAVDIPYEFTQVSVCPMLQQVRWKKYVTKILMDVFCQIV